MDAAWRAWNSFQAAGKALSEVLDGIHDQPDAAAIARFRAAAEPIDRELARALSGDAKAGAAARLPGLVAQWKAAAPTLLGEKAATAIPAPHAMEKRKRDVRNALHEVIADARARQTPPGRRWSARQRKRSGWRKASPWRRWWSGWASPFRSPWR